MIVDIEMNRWNAICEMQITDYQTDTYGIESNCDSGLLGNTDIIIVNYELMNR